MTATTTSKATYDINYVPDFEKNACAGAKGAKKFGRPAILETRYYKVQTPDGVKINTYVFFGGVPTKKVHDQLVDLGFAVRRRSASYVGRDKKTVVIGDNDRQCYAIYYYLDAPTKEQLSFLAKVTLNGMKFVAEKGQTFLLPTWGAIDSNWGDRNDWLQICTVQPEEKEDAKPEAEAPDATIDVSSFDDMLD